ncbi:MAG: transporter substrate-binding domain-containing protein [Anaerolineae bacterium]|nr:transporter substrate-binding domain-containing protein [Anaerolineae bacterium]
MKRIVWLLIIIAFLLASCTDGEPTEATVPFIPTATPPPPTAPPLQENITTGARVRARGYLAVGIRYDLPPFGYVTERGEVAGFGVDVGRELARRWLGNPEAVRFRQVRTDTAVEHLQAGDVDVVATALTHTQDREGGADFSLPYFIDGQALLVRTADAEFVNSPASLAGRPIGVEAWSGAENVLWAAVEYTPTIQAYDRFDEAVDALSWGGVDAVADLRHKLFMGRHLFPDSAIVGQYTAAPMAFAYPENDPFFADLVNLTFQDMVADGTYAELYGRWFGPEYPPVVESWPGEGTPILTEAPSAANVLDNVAAVRERGRVIAAVVDHAPFAYFDATGAPAGYEASLVRQMAGRWVGDATAVDFIRVSSEEEGRQMLHNGQANLLIGGLTHTRAAEMEIDFSLKTYSAGEGLMVRAGTVITDLANLDGQQVAVVRESRSDEVLMAAARDVGISVATLPQPNLDAAIVALQEGRVIAIAGDRADLLGPSYAIEGIGVPPLHLTHVPLALGLPPGDSAFRDLVNMTLLAMKADNQLATIYTTWFDDTPVALEDWPGSPYRALSLR